VLAETSQRPLALLATPDRTARRAWVLNDEVEHLLGNWLGDPRASRARVTVHKRVAGPTEADQILQYVICRPPSVCDVVDIEASVRGPTPSASVGIAREYFCPESVRKTLVGH
jgi:hypothetical protein